MTSPKFDILKSNQDRLDRIKKICDHYQVSSFWGQDMDLNEIAYFEALINKEKPSLNPLQKE